MSNLKEFVLSLEKEVSSFGEKFIVLRNYEGLPEEVFSKDIDIPVKSGKLANWKNAIMKVCLSLDLSFKAGQETFSTKQNYICGILERKRALQIDLIVNFNWNGVQFFDPEVFFSNIKPYKEGIFKPNPLHESLITFFQGYFYCGHIKQKYRKFINTQVRENPKEFRLGLKEVFGQKGAEKIMAALKDEKYEDILGVKQRKFIVISLFNAIKKRKYRCILDIILTQLLNFKCFLGNGTSKILGNGGHERFYRC